MWDVRGNSRYYYRHLTRNGRRYRIYVGTGPEAERLAAEDVQRIAEVRAEREYRRAWLAQVQAADPPLSNLFNRVTALADAALLCAGYYQHYHGEWRKRGKPPDEHRTPEPTPDIH